jgi:TRAP-type mannitol/chloroaromatic compound transport system permease small subunit
MFHKHDGYSQAHDAGNAFGILREMPKRGGETPMQALLTLSRIIDATMTRLGRLIAWFIFAAVVVSTANALVRKIFDMSSNSWLELQWLLFGFVFLLCSPWTLLSNEHIRIDIINSRLPQRARNLIDLFGHAVFLFPFALVMVMTSLPFAIRSIIENEQSSNAGGLPQWPAKLLIFVGFLALLIQSLSEFIKRLAIMRGDLQDTGSGGGHHASAEAEAERLLAAAQAEPR